jgi:hypothetical protein
MDQGVYASNENNKKIINMSSNTWFSSSSVSLEKVRESMEPLLSSSIELGFFSSEELNSSPGSIGENEEFKTAYEGYLNYLK